MQKVIIISGATGDLGKAYVKHYSKEKDCLVYAISRREEKNPLKNVNYLLCDLEKSKDTEQEVKKISLDGVLEVVLIHPVGRFKFEKNGVPEVKSIEHDIDDEVLKSNLDSFHNIVLPLLNLRKDKNILIKLVCFGSLSDVYNVPWWKSYSKSKLILREDMRAVSTFEKNLQALFLNLSSVKTFNEHKTRPFADTSFWLSPEEIVERSVPLISSLKENYTEVDLYNHSPEYHEGYYKDFKKLKEKWLKEMNG